MSTPLLEGKTVVVTGAGAGLGRAYARALGAAGARVVLNDVDGDGVMAVAGQINEDGGAALAQVGSIADWETARQLTRVCVDRFGGIDGLVNNAAIQHAADPGQETEARVRRIVEVNVLGSMFAALHAFEAMRAQGHGRILNVTSGAHVGLSGMTAYGTTKGAVASLTYNLALEAAPVGIQVNALAPVAQTAMSPAGQRPDGVVRPEPDQIAPVVVFLMSDLAGPINGQVVRYDGASLSMLERPHFSTHRVTEDIDTPEGIGRAFAGRFSDAVAAGRLY